MILYYNVFLLLNIDNLWRVFLLFCTFATDKSCLTSKRMHIAEIRTVAKSLPPLR